ncbi:adenosine deaminase [Gulosibacter chungangensis]|uniref:adenosine deaminase n=1 Tax=Gulosibacter chungangensis TaxID=979746 RepID=A0A7J5BET6_9MICO|nr:adenosine deaminase [Gulosibacter chungangensis]KAB1644773.1 adenosine deaminase [Gulosibacter chungangensis]
MTEEDFILPDGVDARRLPKVLLHDHLDGGLRPNTIVELAEEIDFELPESDPELLAKWFRDSADSGSLPSYLATFSVTVGVMQTAQALRRIAREAVVDLAADGVIYAELRWAPEQHLGRGLTLGEAVDAVAEGIAQGIADVEATGGWIRAQQILCAMRQAHRSDEIAELVVERYDSHLVPGGVCGFDLAGPEAGFPAADHAAAFDYCAEEFVPVTVHAGEADGLDSIESAVLDARALRLGHGIRIADDIELHDEDADGTFAQLGDLAEWVKNRRIALEIAPTSNLQTGGVPSLAAHPFNLLYELGFAVTVNTDNRLMSSTTASLELARLANEFDYDLDDLEEFQFAACEAAFLPVEDRDRLADRVADGFDEARI